MTTTKKILVAILLLLILKINGQQPAQFKNFPDTRVLSEYGLQYPRQVKQFYTYNGFQYVWLSNNQLPDLQILSRYIYEAPAWGLRTEDYQPELFQQYFASLIPAKNEHDSLLTDLRFTDAAIHFIHDVLMGNKLVLLSYNGLNYSPSCYNVAAILRTSIHEGRFKSFLNDIESREPGYQTTKDNMTFFLNIISAPGFRDVVVKRSKDVANPLLLTRLYQMGVIDSPKKILSKTHMNSKVKEVQKLFGLSPDGIVGKATLAALNIPLNKRLEELRLTLNTLRWLSCLKLQENHVILVNIPSATLLLYEHQKVVLESKVIVGKASTPTSTLSGRITEVILYPYWNVPFKIATKELLPRIQRDPVYLSENNYQVLNKKAKIMDPYSINWNRLNRSYFPYVIRQSTGCDNSLGLIKLNFYNPFTIYLHDTPYKSLFSETDRFFSHGCIRVQRAIELGHYVLNNNTIAIDTLTQKGCLYNQSPVTVAASEQIPVLILYQTAWIGLASHQVRFYKDIYHKFPVVK